MSNVRNRLIHPLAYCAILSVATFSGIGIAAITGQLSMGSERPELFRTANQLNNQEVLPVRVTVAVAKPTHVGLTRRAVNGDDGSGKPMIYRVGQRFSQTLKPPCDRCGVVQSIERHDLQMPAKRAHNRVFALKVGNASKSTDRFPVSLLADADRNTFDERKRNYEGATSFIVRLRMEDGSVRTIYEHQDPQFSIGQKVQLVNGAVVSMG